MNIYQNLVLLTTSTALSFAAFKTPPAEAANIIQDQTNGAYQILAFSPIGQTFTAEDAFIQSIGFSLADFNPTFAPDDFSITVKLYEGIGTSGLLLGSGVFDQLVDDFNGWADVDFTSVVLNVGNSYTAIVEDDTVRWGVEAFNENLYLGGQAILYGSLNETTDLRFRVLTRETAAPTSVPEPSTIAGLSLLSLSFLLWKRSNKNLL